MSGFVSFVPFESTVVADEAAILITEMADPGPEPIASGMSTPAIPIADPIVYDTTEKNVTYSNDFEYRAWLRRLMCMIPPKDIDPDIDEISLDEMTFDERASEAALNYVYDRTQHHPLFQELYSLAAATMFSLDRSFGISVLFSYDYMALFHQCICCFFETPDEFTETYSPYVCLRKKLT